MDMSNVMTVILNLMIYALTVNINVQFIVQVVIKILFYHALMFVEMELLLEMKNVMMAIILNMMDAIIVNINVKTFVLNVLKGYVMIVNMDGR